MRNVDALCAAVWSHKEWMPSFTRREYPEAFKKYQETYGEAYAQAVRECDGDLGQLEQLADAILDGLEGGWKRQRFWNRSAARTDERHMVIFFLSPMLMEQTDLMCGRLAGLMRQRWADRWPKEEYHLTTYEVIQSGFRNSILGIDLSGKRLDLSKDRK